MLWMLLRWVMNVCEAAVANLVADCVQMLRYDLPARGGASRNALRAAPVFTFFPVPRNQARPPRCVGRSLPGRRHRVPIMSANGGLSIAPRGSFGLSS